VAPSRVYDHGEKEIYQHLIHRINKQLNYENVSKNGLIYSPVVFCSGAALVATFMGISWISSSLAENID
jgi:hypothetical protein